ncbi:MAG: hypothetical protein GPJ21_25155 [Microcystis aeruginosa W13-11]|nr:hypothetical protein [Microcystis aeruginosa W13-11]
MGCKEILYFWYGVYIDGAPHRSQINDFSNYGSYEPFTDDDGHQIDRAQTLTVHRG